jgi:hypothetical protein
MPRRERTRIITGAVADSVVIMARRRIVPSRPGK